MMSDNTKTFISVSSDIKKIRQDKKVQQHLTNKRINWKFIIEKAPWWRGALGAAVAEYKEMLKKKTTGHTSLTFKELCTVIVEIESTYNY